VIRTRIREDQEQDLSFVSESELNEFFTSVVITGTEDTTSVVQTFKQFFPGQGLIIVDNGLTVTTGTQTVTISGFRNEFVSASGSLQQQIQVAGGVTSITASGITISGGVTFEGIGGVSLYPDFSTSALTISGSGVTSLGGTQGSVTITGAGTVDVITLGSTIVVSGTPHTPVPNALVGVGQVIVISGTNTTTISGQPSVGNALVGGANVTITSGTNTITIASVNDVSDALVGTRGIVVISGTNTTTLDFVPTALIGTQGVVVTSGSNTITIGHVPKALVSDNFASVISGTNTDTIVHKAITGSQGNVVITGTSSVNIGHVPKALISDNFGSVISGTNTDTIVHKAIVGDNFLSVVTGTNSVRLLADAIVGDSPVTITSGTNTVTINVGQAQAATAQRGFTKESEGVSTTSSTTFQNKLSLSANLATVATGTTPEPYRILWTYEYGYSSSSNEFEGRLEIDNKDTVHYIVDRPIATATGTFSIASGFIDALLSSGTHTFDIDFRSSAVGKTARIRAARVSVVQLTLGTGSSTPPRYGT
jgi:hypothetical protein